jgi:hypothetical protein
MNYSKFSVRIPLALRQQLEAEAANQSRSLAKQLTAILKERYAHSPPMKTHTSQSHTTVAKNGNRKTKAEVN